MITLYGFGRAFGLPDPSPFVTKVEVLLILAGLPYERKRALPKNGPKGKIPYIVDDGVAIGDSTFIRWHLEEKHGIDFTAGYSKADLAAGWAIEKMLESQTYWVEVINRWSVDANFEKGPAQFFASVPSLLRPFIVGMVRRKFDATSKAQGMGRHSMEDMSRIGIADITAVSDFLGDKSFLLGDRPSGADATVFAFVSGVLCPLFDSRVRDAAEGMPNILAYADRCRKTFYPNGF